MSNDAVKRIMAEVRELSALNAQPGTLFHAAPMETDLFEWHFTVRGPPDTPFDGGLYHGRILLPAEYPLKAPEIILLTPNGRFEVGTRICLSVTSHHNETWQPSWGVRTILTALIGFMPSKSEGLGALDYPPEDRRALARKSLAGGSVRRGAPRGRL
jgi:ubiquitin-conjugating enzyme E2 J1